MKIDIGNRVLCSRFFYDENGVPYYEESFEGLVIEIEKDGTFTIARAKNAPCNVSRAEIKKILSSHWWEF